MKKTTPTEPIDWIKALRQHGLHALQPVYQHYREEFLQFGQRYTTKQEDILDAYQDAMVALYENVSSGRLQYLHSSLKTYLFSIGKFILLHKVQQEQRIQHIHDADLDAELPPLIWEPIELTERQRFLRQALQELGGTCRELLLLFYYERFSIEAIVSRMGYKNGNTAKAHKSRCMKTLREIIQQKTQAEGGKPEAG